MSEPLLLLAVALMALLFWLSSAYTRLSALESRVSQSFAVLAGLLDRRCPLVRELLGTVAAYMGGEHPLVLAVAQAREAACEATRLAAVRPEDLAAMRALDRASNELYACLRQLLAGTRAYPALIGDPAMRPLSQELEELERGLLRARHGYNDAVAQYNATVGSPALRLVARGLGFALTHPLTGTGGASHLP